ATLTVGVAACAPVGPNYARPAVTVPAQYRFVTDPTQATSLADLPWGQVFDDPALQGLIRDAIANNPDLQAAVARLELARVAAGVAASFLYPQIDATGAHTVRQSIGGDDTDVKQGGLYGFQLSWELDLFGRLRREREAAYALMLASEQ